nr:MAG: hypothetical protein 1 [Dicistroviridae sp.]
MTQSKPTTEINLQAIDDKNIPKLLNDIAFERKHPFLTEWKEWQQVCYTYHSDTVIELSKEINKGFRKSGILCLHPIFSWIVDEVYWQSHSLYGELCYGTPVLELWKQHRFNLLSKPVGMEDECNCYYWRGKYPDEWDPSCKYKELHLKCNVISMLWAYYWFKTPRRTVRKYYKRLERVILSLPYDKLMNFDISLILDPPRYPGRGRFLLRELYARAYFDKLEPQQMAFSAEFLKHFRVQQQSGTLQSQSAELISDELMDLAEKVFSKYTLEQCMNVNRVKQQLGFTVDHKVDFLDSNFDRMRNVVLDSQRTFLSGLKQTVMDTGKALLIMFCTASTIGLLIKITLGFSAKIAFNLLHWIYSLVCGSEMRDQILKSNRVIQQSNEDEVSVPFLPAMILNHVIDPPKEILAKIWQNKNTDTVMRRIGYLGDPKIERGLERLTEWLHTVAATVVNWFRVTWLGLDPIEDITNTAAPINTWSDEVDDIVAKYYSGEFAWTESNWSIIMNLYSRGLTLARQPIFVKHRAMIWKTVQQLGNILEKFKLHQRSGANIRNPPVTIYLTGGTGVGKSSITYPLAAEILKAISLREQFAIDLKKCWKSLIYMRSAEQEFWDGYENQLVTVFDDFNQLADSASNPSIELFEIIRASNSFPYPLHMADIAQKANTYFTSKIIIVSSNMEKPKTQSLNFPDALQRRFDICVRVNRKKIDGNIISETFDPSLYELELYDMKDSAPIDTIGYKELVLMCSQEYFRRKTFVDSVDSYIQSQLEDRPIQQGKYVIDERIRPLVTPTYTLPESPHMGEYATYLPRRDKYGKAYPMTKFEKFKFLSEKYVWGTVRSIFMPWMALDAINNQVDEFKNNAKPWHDDYDKRNLFYSLRECSQYFKNKREELHNHWKNFREQHPYLVKAGVMLTVLATSLAFLKMYYSIINTFKKEKKEEKVMSPEKFIAESEGYSPAAIKGVRAEGWLEDWIHKKRFGDNPTYIALSVDWINDPYKEQWIEAGCPQFYKLIEGKVVAESYIPPPPKGVKMEAYSPTLIKNAKVEAYSPTMPKTARVEGELPRTIAEGVKDVNAAEILMSVARKNLYKISESTRDAVIGHVLFLKGKVAIMPKHYMTAFLQSLSNDPEATISFEAVLLKRSFAIKIRDLLKTKIDYESPDERDGPVWSRDLMAVSVETSIIHTDATNSFVSRNNMFRVDSTSVCLPVLVANEMKNTDRAVLLVRFATGQSQLTRTEKLAVGDDDNAELRFIRDAWTYNMDTRPTECGAPLIVRNTQISPGKICGIHVAGMQGTGQGFATPIYQEDVFKILSYFPPEKQFEQQIRIPLLEYPKEQSQVPEQCEFIRLGSVERPVAQPGKSKIEPSLCYASITPPKTKPCALRSVTVEGAEFDPRAYRIGRLGNIPTAISEELIGYSRAALVDEMSSVLKKNSETQNANIKNVYTFEEAVKGIEGEPFIQAIKRNTSPGYPFVHMKGYENRKNFFGKGEEYDLTSRQCQHLKLRVEQIIDYAKKGIVLDHIFMDTLKDERKPIHKAHKTRLFAAGPIDYLIACKQYFNPIVALLQKNRNWCHISVGTNPYSQDWDEIARSLLRKSDQMVAGDFEGFDASQHQRLLEASGEVLIELSRRFCGSTKEDIRVMRVLLVSLFNSIHITGKEVYQWTHSLPSGHYLTAIINSIFVNISFLCIWQLAFSMSYASARSFYQLCGIVAYGDDHIVSIPPSVLEKFNQLTIPELFKIIGLSYTMEDKDATATIPSRKISEISYLKRGFRWDESSGRWFAPLSLDTILETPMWLHRCPDRKLQTIDNLEWAIKELALHDEEIWKIYSPILMREGERLGHYTLYKEHLEARVACLSQSFEM